MRDEVFISDGVLSHYRIYAARLRDGQWGWRTREKGSQATHWDGIVATREEAVRAALAEVVRRCDAERDRALALLEKYKEASHGV